MRTYELLLRLYPAGVRYAYAREMQASFERKVAMRRHRGAAAGALAIARDLGALVFDAAMQRISALYSHRSFHGRCEPDLGVVRPPNMSKAEWFGTAD